MYDNNEKPEQLNILRDTNYIKNEIISQQVDGNYVKYSRILKCVSVIGLTKDSFIGYWEKKYKNSKDLPTIIECCKNKLTNGLTDPNKMILLIQNSKDFQSEKEKAIKLLGGVFKSNA